MAYRIAENKIKLLAQEYCNNGYNRKQAMIAAGYSVNYASAGQSAKVFEDVRLVAEIERIEASKRDDMQDITIGYIQSEHKRLLAVAEAASDPVNAARHLEGLGKTIGAYKEHSINESLDTAPKPELSEAEAIAERKRAELKLKTG